MSLHALWTLARFVKQRREGKLPDYSIDDLRVMSQTCARWMQGGNGDAVHTKDSVDKEIHRKEVTEAEQCSMQRSREDFDYQNP